MKRKLDDSATEEETTTASSDLPKKLKPSSSSSSSSTSTSQANRKKSKEKGGSKAKKKGDEGFSPNSPPTVLAHRNRELSCLVKKLKLKLRKCDSRANSLQSRFDDVQAMASTFNRSLEEILLASASILGLSPDHFAQLAQEEQREQEHKNAEEEEEERKKKKRNDKKNGEQRETEDDEQDKVDSIQTFLERLYGHGLHERLVKSIAAKVSINVEEDEECDENQEDMDEVKRDQVKREKMVSQLPVLVEKKTKVQVRLVRELLKQLAEKVLGAGDTEREAASKRLLLSHQDGVSLSIQLRQMQSILRLSLDRQEALNTQVKQLQHQLEDTENERDIIRRRLTAVCSDALSAQQVQSLADRMNLPIQQSADASSSSSTSNMNGPGIKSGGEKSEKESAQIDAETKEWSKVASDRLKEIQKHVEEKKTLVDEIESLRVKLGLLSGSSTSASKGQPSGEGEESTGTEGTASLERVLEENQTLRSELHRAKQDNVTTRAALEDARQAMAQVESTALEAIKAREEELLHSIKERETAILQLRSKLESARNQLKVHLKAEDKCKEYEVLVETLTTRTNSLQNEVNQLRESPPIVLLKSKLEQALADKWPVGQEEKSKAMLQVELETAKKELESSTSYAEALVSEMQQMTDLIKTSSEQNERLLKKVSEKESEVKRWSNKLLEMNETITKLKNQQKSLKKQLDEEKRLRTAADEQFAFLNNQLDMHTQAAATAEDLARSTHASISSIRAENEALKKSVALLEASKIQLEAGIKSLEQSNKTFRKDKEDAVYDKNRAEEDRKKLKKRLEKAKTLTDPATLDVRTEMMENALRCPLRSEYWKDAIIIKCCHMFSKKALEDNLAKRNRKCPTCKHAYNKEDIREIYLYQKNDYTD